MAIRGLGPSNGPGDGRAIRPVHPSQALVAGTRHPQLDRGHANPEAARHRTQGCPMSNGSDHSLSLLSQSAFCALLNLRTGIRKNGAAILPPMPWEWYNELSDDDLKAIFAYLRTIPPIKSRVPENLPPARR